MNFNSSEEQAFLKRLNAIVEANLQNEQFGVNELAAKAGLSRSQVHRRLKTISNKSVSQFIREVRLEKAKEFLDEGNLTVSEIAWKVGFGSPSYFIKSFHDLYGYPPGDEKKHLTNMAEKEGQNQSQPKTDKLFTSRRKLIYGFAVIVIFLFTYFVWHILPIGLPAKRSNNTPEKSVIVLPLENLTPEKENQYLADGISEDIRSQLAKIQGLKVISGMSSEKYRETLLSAPEIARQVNAEYILAGSIRQWDSILYINIALSDALQDRVLWPGKYERKMEDIFKTQLDIAQNVADQLHLILSPEEIEQIEKRYTDNPEAYDLYLQGRFYHRTRTKEGFQKSLEYHTKALELDSNYCLAYAGLADVYVTGTYFRNFTRDEGIPKSRAYALKALSIDKNLAEAHATLGAIAIYFDYDWETAEKELNLAITLNPRYPRAYHLYAQYLAGIGKEEEANLYLNKALELDPSDRQLNREKYFLYRRAGVYDKALEFSDKIRFIDRDEKEYFWRNLQIYLRQNNITKVIEEFKNYQSVTSPGVAPEIIDSIYAEKGKDGIIRFLIELKKSELGPNSIAVFYSIINEKDSAIIYLEHSFEIGHAGLVRALGEKEFDNLRSEPRFKELIRKMNLEGIDFTQ